MRKLCGVVSDDFDSILVSTNSTIRTLTKEYTLYRSFWYKREHVGTRQGQVCHIVSDGSSKVVLGLLAGQIIKHSNHVSWYEIFARLTKTSTDDGRYSLNTAGFDEGVNDIESKGFASGGILLTTVKYTEALACFGQLRLEKCLGKRSVQIHTDNTYFASVLV